MNGFQVLQLKIYKRSTMTVGGIKMSKIAQAFENAITYYWNNQEQLNNDINDNYIILEYGCWNNEKLVNKLMKGE